MIFFPAEAIPRLNPGISGWGLAEMVRPQNDNVVLDLDFQIGLGWALNGLGELNLRNAGKVIHHSGATSLFHSQMILLPDHKLGVVALANSASARPVVNRAAVEALKLALEAKTGIAQPPEVRWAAGEETVPEETLRAFEGQYTTLLGTVSVARRGRKLRAEAGGRAFSLVPHDEAWFGLRYRLLGLVPITIDELDPYAIRRATLHGREIFMVSDGYTRLLAGERLEQRALSEAWRQRSGKYEIVNPGQDEQWFDDPALVIKDGCLLLRVKSVFGGETGELVVEPLSDTEALLLEPLAGAGETIRVVMIDGVEMWRYSGYLFKRIAD